MSPSSNAGLESVGVRAAVADSVSSLDTSTGAARRARCGGFRRWTLACWFLLGSWSTAAWAQPAPSVADAPPPAPAPAREALSDPADVFDNLTPADEARLRSLVQQYIQEHDAQRPAAVPAPQPPASDPSWMKGVWKHGLTFESADKQHKVHIGGRTQFDVAWFGVPNDIQNDPTLVNPYGDGVDFRRVRVKVDGTMYDFIDWAFQIDFVNSVRDGTNVKAVPAPTDLWWTFTKLDYIGNIRIGNQKEPIGFEHLVSSRFLPFLERSFNQDAFYGGFNNGFTPGVSAFNVFDDERATWAFGVYKPTNNVFVSTTNSGDYAATGRATYLPWYEDHGAELLHLGFSVRHSSGFNGAQRLRTRGPERSGLSAVWPLPADTGNFVCNNNELLNAELVGVYGPWTFQSEYLASFCNGVNRADGTDVGTAFFHGGYAQIFYFLTGEHDEYSRKAGVFERVVPHCNAQPSGALVPLFCGGAWQVGVRYNYLDLTNQGILGGVLNDVTAGLNWYLNPNMKIQWNYSATHRESGTGAGDGWIHGFGMRFAQDF